MSHEGQVLVDHYRCPRQFAQVGVSGELSEKPGFFSFGPEAVGYGRCSAFVPSPDAEHSLTDAWGYVTPGPDGPALPFSVAETVAALRREQYVRNGNQACRESGSKLLVRAGYYAMRPLMPVAFRKHLQRYSLRGWKKRVFPRWPVDTSVESTIESVMALNLRLHKEVPFIWFWPEGAQACAVMTHDVETAEGRDFCTQLMDIDDSFRIKASFQVVPERRYALPVSYLENLRDRGFEINVHDLNHDGHLFDNHEQFKRRVARINHYGKALRAKGFRAGALYRNIDWFDLFQLEYDMSVPNVAHLDPQCGGCCTVFPYFVGKILEIPVTMTQDYSLFHILCNYGLDIWEEQAALILEKHGVMNFIVHPDYILQEREQEVYRRLLRRLSELRRTRSLWIALPGAVNDWWRQRSKMRLVANGGQWEIIGEGKENARIAYARLENGRLTYTF